jgi:hypothetical protein
MNRTKLALLIALALCVAPSMAMAVPTVTINGNTNVVLQPNMAGQVVTLTVAGGDD